MIKELVTDQEIQNVLAETEAASNAWMRGDSGGYRELIAHTDDFTIMGPFGGPTAKGFDTWAKRAPAMEKNFQRGQSRVRLVQSYTSRDLLVLVLNEEQRGEIAGGPEQSWSLRVTQVYRRENGKWRVVHRHADPLVRLLSVQEGAALARG